MRFALQDPDAAARAEYLATREKEKNCGVQTQRAARVASSAGEGGGVEAEAQQRRHC